MIDGAHRLTKAKREGVKELPAHIVKVAAGPKIRKANIGSLRGGYSDGVITLNRNLRDPKDIRTTTRHELTHYINDVKGRYPRTKQNNIRGVKDTFLNEVSARRSEVPKNMKSYNPLIRAGRAVDTIGDSVRSVKSVYGNNLLKALKTFR